MKLELQGVQSGYGKIGVLWGIDLVVAEGEFVAMIGANGAGKTTALRTISGLVPCSAGSIRLNGQEISKAPSSHIVRMGLGHVPEGRQLFPLMTVQENLELGAQIREEAWKERAVTLKHMFELFPRVQERKHQLAGTLSGGEQQMVAIARALMSLPKVLLVDEPSLGLSPLMTQTVFQALKAVNAEGVGVLLVEQNVKQSLQLASRGYVLEHGEMVKNGSGQDLLHDPEVQNAYLAV